MGTGIDSDFGMNLCSLVIRFVGLMLVRFDTPIIDLPATMWNLAQMSSKRRYLILMLILWLPVQGLAAALLHCDMHSANAASDDESSSLHQHHTPVPSATGDEPGSSALEAMGYHDSSHNASDSQHFDPCQQCCQVCSTLISSSALTGSQALATPVIWPTESVDSIVSDPLFHPPQNLS